MQEKVRDLTRKVKSVLISYPMVLATATVTACAEVYMIEHERESDGSFLPVRIAIAGALGISVFFAMAMLSQRIGRSVLLHITAALFLIGYFFILPAKESDFTSVYAFVVVPTFVLSHLMVAFIPFLGKSGPIGFWQYNKNLFINIFLAGIFTGVLTGGVELAIVSIDQLFSMSFKGPIYGETFAVLATFGSVLIFLLFNEKGLAHLEKDSGYPLVLKFFTQFILIPLLSIYLVILYFYSAKILLHWALPEGWVSYLVLAYSIVGILALLLVHPLKGDSARSWVKIFGRLFYFSLLPLLVLLYVAIFTRVLQYGFTEARYYVLLLAVWLLGVVAYFIVIRKADIRFIPVSLFSLGLLSLVCPYLNTFSVSVRSQKHELERLLRQYDLLDNHKIKFDAKVPFEIAASISNKFDYLSQRFEADYLGNYLDTNSKKAFAGKTVWDVNSLFINRTENSAKRYRNFELKSARRYANTEGFRYVVSQNQLLNGGISINADRFTLQMDTYGKHPEFVLKLNSTQSFDCIPAIKKIFDKYNSADGTRETDDLFVAGDLGEYRVKIVFDAVGRRTYQGNVTYDFSDALFLITEK